jgi:hypothetical protein
LFLITIAVAPVNLNALYFGFADIYFDYC